jgi:hypothetical protein
VHLGPFSLPSTTLVAELVKSFGFRRVTKVLTTSATVLKSSLGTRVWGQAKCREDGDGKMGTGGRVWGQAKCDEMLALKFKRDMACPRSPVEIQTGHGLSPFARSPV